MRRLWQKKTALLFALLFLAVELMPSMTVHAYTSARAETAGMEKVAQSDQAELYLDREDALLYLVDKQSGIAIQTKVMDGKSGNGSVKANQKSDFIISYFLNSKATSAQSQVNYTMAIELGQMTYEEIDNGIRILYTMKEDKLSVDCVPKYISQERMESLVLNHLDSKQRKWMQDYYRLYEGRYTRTKDTNLTQSTIKLLYERFYELGEYTEEDLEADNAEWGYESQWSNLEIQAAVEYVLDGGDLVVRVPIDRLTVNNEDVIVNAVTLLPYLLSSDDEQEGYFVVPDGSGAVINFNNGLKYAVDYSSRIYGKDVLMDVMNLPNADYFANMPMIGAVYEDYAVLAIVENGEGMAEINVQVAGKMDDYNKAYFRFYITEKENVATLESTNVNVNKFTGDIFSGSIQVRYKLLTGAGENNYTGLAHAYQEYLIRQGVLKPLEKQETAPYLEVLGSTLEYKTMLGFPYQGVMDLTTFKETEAILNDLSSRGVSNVNVQLDGWLDGGQRHENLSSVKLEGSQGSKSSYKALVETAASLGYGLYPDVAFQCIYPSYDMFEKGSDKRYAKKYGSRYLSNEYAILTEVPVAGFNVKTMMLDSPYLISPAYLESYMEKAVKGLNKLGTTGVTVTDMGMQLVADYNEKAPVSRNTAIEKVAAAMSTLQESCSVVVKAPYQYAWRSVERMSDLPTRSTEYTIFNYDIPFLQLVLDGCVSYSTEPLNYQTQKDMSDLLLKCIETRSNPKFYVMDAEMDELKYAVYADYLSINYRDWADRIEQLYQEYEAFADKVEGSTIASHETLAENLVKVTYENGVTVYVNYGDKKVSAEGRELAARSYLLTE